MFFDYDRDGLLDLYLCNVGQYTNNNRRPDGAFVGLTDAFSGHLHPDRSEKAILYRNLGGRRFKDVTAEVGLGDAGWSGDASFADLNGDGFPDLYALNMQGSNHYFENDGGKRFVDKTAQVFPRTSWGAMGIKFFDYDNDGRPDLFITDMHSDMSVEVGPDRETLKSRDGVDEGLPAGRRDRSTSSATRSFTTSGNGRFEEVSDRLGVENYWPWGPSIGDLNADGWQDIFIAVVDELSVALRHQLAAAEQPRRAVPRAASSCSASSRAATAGRTPDGSTSTARRPRWPAQQGCAGRTGKVTVMASLGTRSSVMLDIDGDGDLDIVTNEFNAAPQVLVSNLAATPAGALGRRGADRDGVEPERPGRGGAGHGGRTRADRVARRQVGLSLAEPAAALLRARRRDDRGSHRGRLAVGPEAGGDRRTAREHDHQGHGAAPLIA